MDSKNVNLQELCRYYLQRLSGIASKYGLSKWLGNIIESNKRGECSSTEEEVEMLSRMVDDERLARTEVPKVLGKSYRQCFDDDDFGKIKKLRRVGIYSKISTMLLLKTSKDED